MFYTLMESANFAMRPFPIAARVTIHQISVSSARKHTRSTVPGSAAFVRRSSGIAQSANEARQYASGAGRDTRREMGANASYVVKSFKTANLAATRPDCARDAYLDIQMMIREGVMFVWILIIQNIWTVPMDVFHVILKVLVRHVQGDHVWSALKAKLAFTIMHVVFTIVPPVLQFRTATHVMGPPALNATMGTFLTLSQEGREVVRRIACLAAMCLQIAKHATGRHLHAMLAFRGILLAVKVNAGRVAKSSQTVLSASKTLGHVVRVLSEDIRTL